MKRRRYSGIGSQRNLLEHSSRKTTTYLFLTFGLLLVAILCLFVRSWHANQLELAVQSVVLHATHPAISTSQECGKVCSTDFDSKEDGRYYPLLRKQVDCQVIMRRMAHNLHQVIKPPPREPPKDLVRSYTQNGECPLGTPWYFDESNPSGPAIYSRKWFESLLQREKSMIINHYVDKHKLKPALSKHLSAIKDKHVAVIGTQMPWAEAVLLNMGVKRITTIEYNKLVIEHQRVHVSTPTKYAQNFLHGNVTLFDATFTYSSLEHTGLGRYGDPLMPFGDFEAVAQLWCMTKSGGYLFLALPTSPDPKQCTLRWNALRWYGYIRLQHVTANWKVLDMISMGDDGNQVLYVAQKLPS